MKGFVVDASVAVKWFVPEVHSPEARLFLASGADMWSPGLMVAEVGNLLWKKVVRKEITADDARDILAALPAMPVQIQPAEPLVAAAFELAQATGITVYDGIYVALSQLLGCACVTGDCKRVDRLAGSAFDGAVRWIGRGPAD